MKIKIYIKFNIFKPHMGSKSMMHGKCSKVCKKTEDIFSIKVGLEVARYAVKQAEGKPSKAR